MTHLFFHAEWEDNGNEGFRLRRLFATIFSLFFLSGSASARDGVVIASGAKLLGLRGVENSFWINGLRCGRVADPRGPLICVPKILKLSAREVPKLQAFIQDPDHALTRLGIWSVGNVQAVLLDPDAKQPRIFAYRGINGEMKIYLKIPANFSEKALGKWARTEGRKDWVVIMQKRLLELKNYSSDPLTVRFCDGHLMREPRAIWFVDGPAELMKAQQEEELAIKADEKNQKEELEEQKARVRERVDSLSRQLDQLYKEQADFSEQHMDELSLMQQKVGFLRSQNPCLSAGDNEKLDFDQGMQFLQSIEGSCPAAKDVRDLLLEHQDFARDVMDVGAQIKQISTERNQLEDSLQNAGYPGPSPSVFPGASPSSFPDDGDENTDE